MHFRSVRCSRLLVRFERGDHGSAPPGPPRRGFMRTSSIRGHADRRVPRIGSNRGGAKHQLLHHLAAKAPSDETKPLGRARTIVLRKSSASGRGGPGPEGHPFESLTRPSKCKRIFVGPVWVCDVRVGFATTGRCYAWVDSSRDCRCLCWHSCGGGDCDRSRMGPAGAAGRASASHRSWSSIAGRCSCRFGACAPLQAEGLIDGRIVIDQIGQRSPKISHCGGKSCRDWPPRALCLAGGHTPR
jgi:hypothetical protein